MKITPTYELSVFSEDDFKEKMAAVSEQLDQCRHEGSFAGFDGKLLHYEYFQAENSRGAVVIVHGLSEFTGKYHEFAWHLLNQGFDVFLYDQRSHGFSCRLTPRQDLIHVDHFSDYQKDLHCFVCDVVRKATDKPLYLYGHSMGGGVALQYLAGHPDVFEKAALSAPMIEPLTGGISPTIARLGLSFYLLFTSGKKKFWLCGEFDPDYPFSRSHDQSLARFQRNMEIRLSDSRYCTTPYTLRWVLESLRQRRKMMKKRFINRLHTPILMLCAEEDTVVSWDAQAKFAKKCPACKRVVLENTTHGMHCGTSDTVAVHLRQVLDHFS
ncbi:MAG: alpha/beta hydrolase [Oscillospiraceae bacterium]|nr:alpha/beta hydrolase [Oscillospiraceae bacterium]